MSSRFGKPSSCFNVLHILFHLPSILISVATYRVSACFPFFRTVPYTLFFFQFANNMCFTWKPSIYFSVLIIFLNGFRWVHHLSCFILLSKSCWGGGGVGGYTSQIFHMFYPFFNAIHLFRFHLSCFSVPSSRHSFDYGTKLLDGMAIITGKLSRKLRTKVAERAQKTCHHLGPEIGQLFARKFIMCA
jgi:hypothetical protein